MESIKYVQEKVTRWFVFGMVSSLLLMVEINFLTDFFSFEVVASLSRLMLNLMLVAVLCYKSMKLAKEVDLPLPFLEAWMTGKRMPKLMVSGVALVILAVIVFPVSIVMLESQLFLPLMPELADSMIQTVWWKGMLGTVYGGIVEEMIARLGIMTLIVWLLFTWFPKAKESDDRWVYWTAILVSSFSYALVMTFYLYTEITGLLLIRSLVLNGGFGIAAGYLYWRKGWGYAVIAHLLVDLITYGYLLL